MSITIESLKIELATLNKQIEELKQELVATKNQIVPNEKQIKNAEQEVLIKHEIVDEHRTDLWDLKINNIKYNGSLKEITEKINKAKQDVSNAKLSVKQAKNQLKETKLRCTLIRKKLALLRKQVKATKQHIKELKNPVIVEVIEPVVVPIVANVVITTLDCPVCFESKNDTQFFKVCRNNHKLCYQCYTKCAFTQLQDPSNANGDIEDICKCPMCRQRMKLPASIGQNTHLFMYTMIVKYSMKYSGSNQVIRHLWLDELSDAEEKEFNNEFDTLGYIMEHKLKLKTETDFENWLLDYFNIDTEQRNWKRNFAGDLQDCLFTCKVRI